MRAAWLPDCPLWRMRGIRQGVTCAAEVSILAAHPGVLAGMPIKSQRAPPAELQDENGPAGLVSEQSGCSESVRAAAPVPEEQHTRRPLSQLSRQPTALPQAEQQPAATVKNDCGADGRPADASRQHAGDGETAEGFKAATRLLVAVLCTVDACCRCLLCMSHRPPDAVRTDGPGLFARLKPATDELSGYEPEDANSNVCPWLQGPAVVVQVPSHTLQLTKI